jgi:hypothetical protein
MQNNDTFLQMQKDLGEEIAIIDWMPTKTKPLWQP